MPSRCPVKRLGYRTGETVPAAILRIGVKRSIETTEHVLLTLLHSTSSNEALRASGVTSVSTFLSIFSPGPLNHQRSSQFSGLNTRNHNPRVGGSSPSSGITLFAGTSSLCRAFGGIGSRARDRYEPLETARWLTEQSNARTRVSKMTAREIARATSEPTPVGWTAA
jgi:hypothetical protein